MKEKKPLTRVQVALLIYTGITSRRTGKRFLNRSSFEQFLEIIDYQVADITQDIHELKKRKLITKTGTYVSITSKGRMVAIQARDKIREKYGGFNWDILYQYVSDGNGNGTKLKTSVKTDEILSDAFVSKVSKAGNSYVVRIPSRVAKDKNIAVGNVISLVIRASSVDIVFRNLKVVKDGNSISVRLPSSIMDVLDALSHSANIDFRIENS